jgi:hypothetical protein
MLTQIDSPMVRACSRKAREFAGRAAPFSAFTAEAVLTLPKPPFSTYQKDKAMNYLRIS